MPTRRQFRALPALTLLAACASGGDYPSLQVRDAERVSGTFEPAPAYVPGPASPDALASLSGLRQSAEDAHGAFLAKADATRSAVANGRGAEVGTESWARAQVALADLQSARAPALIALAELDSSYVATLAEAAEISQIDATRDAVVAMVEEQDMLIAELAGAIAQ